MRTLLPPLLTLALISCAPTPSAPPASAEPDPLAVGYEVRVGQATLTNVTSVVVSGPDIELAEFRSGDGETRLVPGNVGPVRLEVRADWTAAERTVEAWRQSLTQPSAGQPLRPAAETVTVTITPSAGAQGASYAFSNCLPTEHQMELGAQQERARLVWRMVCGSVTRS